MLGKKGLKVLIKGIAKDRLGRGGWPVRLVPVDLFVQPVVGFLVPLLLIALRSSLCGIRPQIDQLDFRSIPREDQCRLDFRDIGPNRLFKPPYFLIV